MRTLYGREHEIIELEKCAAWLTSNEQNEEIKSVVLYGPPGIGKTALLAELYRLVYDKSEPNKHGLPYNPELLDLGRTEFLSAALNPGFDQKLKGRSFFWFGVRFDDPEYRQYRPFSFKDSLITLRGVWLDRIGKAQEGAKNASLTILKCALELIPGFTAIEAAREIAEVGGRLVNNVQDGYETLKGLSKEAEDEAGQLEDAILSANLELPTVIVLDNAHWAFAPNSTKDAELLTSVLNKVKSKDMGFVEKITKLIDSPIGKLASGSALKRKRLLVVMTVDSSAYAETLVPKKETEYSLKSMLDSFESNKIALPIRRLNKADSKRLFLDTCRYLETSPRYHGRITIKDARNVRDDIISSSGGLPLRIKEMADLYVAGIPLDGPMESSLIHTKRIRAIAQEEPELQEVLYISAVLAQYSNRFSVCVLSAILNNIKDANHKDTINIIRRLHTIGLIETSDGNNSDIYEFITVEPKYIIGLGASMNRISARLDCLVKNITDTLVDRAGKSINKWEWSSEFPILSWRKVFSKGNISKLEEMSLSKLISDQLKSKFQTSFSNIETSSADEWAIWAISVAEVALIHFSEARSDLSACIWKEHAEAIVGVFNKMIGNMECPPPISDRQGELKPWHYGAWMKFLRMANAAVDPRQGLPGWSLGERSVSQGDAYQRIDAVYTITQQLAATVVSSEDRTNAVQIWLEFVRHWLVSINAINEEFNKYGRCQYFLFNVMSPNGTSTYGGTAIDWFSEAQIIANELRPDMQEFINQALPLINEYKSKFGH